MRRPVVLAAVRLLSVTIVLTWTAAFRSELIKSNFPFIARAQLRCHRWLSQMSVRRPRVRLVTFVEIDDDSFYRSAFAGIQPLRRGVLEDLVRRIAAKGALVVGLDVQFVKQDGSPVPQNTSAEEQHFFATLRQITGSGTPIVLTYALVREGRSSFGLAPPAFSVDSSVPLLTAGHINLPKDKRQIPLKMEYFDAGSDSMRDVESFAMQVVNAYETTVAMKVPTRSDVTIREAESEGEFVYGGFVEPDAFDRLSAASVLAGTYTGTFKGRIVLIGGAWHRLAYGQGGLVESFPSPVGDVPGLYLHGNYVEALLDGRYEREVPVWAAIATDLGVAAILFLVIQRYAGAQRLGVVGIPFLIVLVGYVALTNIGLYFDVILPLGVFVIHVLIETYWEHSRPHVKGPVK